MDLKQDYHQAPLTLATRAYTAIVTFPGVYQPFGPKRAPSYYHETMATAVFIGLIYVICEMYLDDVVLYCTYMHPYIYTVSRTTVQLLHRM